MNCGLKQNVWKTKLVHWFYMEHFELPIEFDGNPIFGQKTTTKQTKNGQFLGKSQVWSRKLRMTRKKLDLTKKFQFFFFFLHKTARLLVWWRFAIYCFALSKIDILRDVIQYYGQNFLKCFENFLKNVCFPISFVQDRISEISWNQEIS